MDRKSVTITYLDSKGERTTRTFTNDNDRVTLDFSPSRLAITRLREVHGRKIYGRTYIPHSRLIDVTWAEPYLYKRNVL